MKMKITIEAIDFGTYRSGELAMTVVDRDGTAYRNSIPGEQLCVATTAVVDHGLPDPGEGCVWLKGWSENEGLPEALQAAGIVTLTGRTHAINFVTAIHAKLTPIALEELARQRAF